MSKRNHIVERASDVNGGQYIQTNSSYNSGYEDGKKAGKEYCAAELAALREQVEKLEALVVMRCDLDVPPQFSQGLQSHEVLEPVTAEHCQWFVAKIEKLTKERDELKTVPMKYRRMQFNAELQDEVTQLQKQLAALAEQNEKMRSFFEFAWKDIPMSEYAFEILEHVMNLPDLATPLLNRLKAEAYREAAELVEAHHTWVTNVAAGKLLRAKSDELEQQCAP